MKPRKQNQDEIQHLIIDKLEKIHETLGRAYPVKDAPWYKQAYEKFTSFVKYIGAPALIIAAILPVFNLVKVSIDTNNKEHFKSVYEGYVHNLLSNGEMERANELFDNFEKQEKRDIKSQYLYSKLLIEQTIRQGVYPEKAEDGVNILLALNKDKPLFFPTFGGEEEQLSLKFSLIDIYIQTQEYVKARNLLGAMGKNQLSGIYNSIFYLKLSTLDVLTYKSKENRENLDLAVELLSKSERIDLYAEAIFQLAKHYQFSHLNLKALEKYDEAATLFKEIEDNRGLIKVLNNKAMIYQSESNYEQSRRLYIAELQLSRRIKDNPSIARCLVNLGGIELSNKNYNKALFYANEASELFHDMDSILGEATAHGILSDVYYEQNNLGKSIYHGKKCEVLYIESKEVRSIALVSYRLGNKYFKHKDIQNTILYYYLSEVLFTFYRNNHGKDFVELRDIKRKLQKIKNETDEVEFKRNISTAEQRLSEINETLNLLKVTDLNKTTSVSYKN